MRIVIAEARAPFAQDVATRDAGALADQLRQRGHEVEAVSLPPSPAPAGIRADATAWRLLDLGHSNMKPIDLLIATGFPAYCVRHPRKVAWMSLEADAAAVPADLSERRARMLAECTRVVASLTRAPDGPWDAVIEQLLG